MKRLLAYKDIYLIVSLFLAVVVTAQMLVFDDAYFGFLKLYREREYRQSRYEFVIELADKEEVENAFNNMPDRIADYLDVTLVGYSLMRNERVQVTTFYPAPYDGRFTYVNSGKSIFELNPGEVICNNNSYGSSADANGNQYLSLRDNLYKLSGVGTPADAYECIDYMNTLYTLQVTYEDYFNIVSKVKGIVVQYDHALNEAEEQTLKDYMNFHFQYEEYVAPEVMEDDSIHELVMRMLFIITMLLMCLICNFSIISYLFFKLSDEYQVRIICGARRYQIILAKMADLLVAGITSFVIGSIAYLIFIYSIETHRSILDSLRFIGANFLIYIVVLYIVFGVGSLFTSNRRKEGRYGNIN